METRTTASPNQNPLYAVNEYGHNICASGWSRACPARAAPARPTMTTTQTSLPQIQSRLKMRVETM
eukprot:scaffold270607_cov36-Tisochrysis_lutea.AAC.4